MRKAHYPLETMTENKPFHPSDIHESLEVPFPPFNVPRVVEFHGAVPLTPPIDDCKEIYIYTVEGLPGLLMVYAPEGETADPWILLGPGAESLAKAPSPWDLPHIAFSHMKRALADTMAQALNLSFSHLSLMEDVGNDRRNSRVLGHAAEALFDVAWAHFVLQVSEKPSEKPTAPQETGDTDKGGPC
jgi:hypothetical protein